MARFDLESNWGWAASESRKAKRSEAKPLTAPPPTYDDYEADEDEAAIDLDEIPPPVLWGVAAEQ